LAIPKIDGKYIVFQNRLLSKTDYFAVWVNCNILNLRINIPPIYRAFNAVFVFHSFFIFTGAGLVTRMAALYLNVKPLRARSLYFPPLWPSV
jgi:hypothetical protein